jgi:hypothetical protein
MTLRPDMKCHTMHILLTCVIVHVNRRSDTSKTSIGGELRFRQTVQTVRIGAVNPVPPNIVDTTKISYWPVVAESRLLLLTRNSWNFCNGERITSTPLVGRRRYVCQNYIYAGIHNSTRTHRMLMCSNIHRRVSILCP